MANADDLERLAKGIIEAVRVSAEEYANGREMGTPIVDRHFTAGNSQRYNWQPLSAGYFKWKQGTITRENTKRGVFYPGAGKKGSKLDKAALFATGRGGRGVKSGVNKPMMVLYGDLRASVNAKNHKIKVSPDGNFVFIIFTNLPDYAIKHHKGIGVPKRSPFELNEEDEKLVKTIAKRHIDKLIRTGTKKPTAFNKAPARILP
jgi:hypothetical protein